MEQASGGPSHAPQPSHPQAGTSPHRQRRETTFSHGQAQLNHMAWIIALTSCMVVRWSHVHAQHRQPPAQHRALPRSWSVKGSATPGAYSQQAGPLMRIQSHTSACDLLAAAQPRHGRSRKTPGFAKATSTSSTCTQSTSPLPPHKSARRLNPRLSNAWWKWRQQPPHAGRRPQVLGSLTYCIPRADSRRTMTQAPPHGESGAHQQHDST